MTATVSRRSAPAKEGGAVVSRASRSRAARRCRSPGSWSLVEVRIWSRVTGILSFGRSSGTVIRALFGRTLLRRKPDAPDQAAERNSHLPARAHSGTRLRTQLRGNRRALRLPVPGHGARASDQSRAQGLHPPVLQRKPLDRSVAAA